MVSRQRHYLTGRPIKRPFGCDRLFGLFVRSSCIASANLHAFDTPNAAIVEGLIWAAIGAAALKRFLAHATDLRGGARRDVHPQGC